MKRGLFVKHKLFDDDGRCRGFNCRLRDSCQRYIDVKKENVPYQFYNTLQNGDGVSCAYYVGNSMGEEE